MAKTDWDLLACVYTCGSQVLGIAEVAWPEEDGKGKEVCWGTGVGKEEDDELKSKIGSATIK